VLDRVDRAGFLVEPLDHIFRVTELGLQHLDRAEPADLAVHAFVHHAHATLGQLAPDHVAA